MAIQLETKRKQFSEQQIAELTAIYNDYLHIARQHQEVVQSEPIEQMALNKLTTMYPNGNFPWKIEPMTPFEQKKFDDFINNDKFEDKNNTYITIRHIKKEEDKGYNAKYYAVLPYSIITMNTTIPASIERYSVFYSAGTKLGNTTFYIDGQYKAVCNDVTQKDLSLEDVIVDYNMIDNIFIMINLADSYYKREYITDEKEAEKHFAKSSANIFANEYLSLGENVILELLGSFAEKLLIVCREIYGIPYKPHYTVQENANVWNRAQQDGLILSAQDFQDYLNIRNFLRHRWDTLEILGRFNPAKAQENEKTRNNYLNSYFKLCDKTIMQRTKAYIDVLHNLQHVINIVNPNRIMRYENESNNKFINRVKLSYQSNPNIDVEINRPLLDAKYLGVRNTLHKILPQIHIVDEYSRESEQQQHIDDYIVRSWFLETFTTIDCMIMRLFKYRGNNYKRDEAWGHITELGVLSDTESEKWFKYIRLRNLIGHNYFSTNLRDKLVTISDEYEKDLKKFMGKLRDAGPEVEQIQPGILKYTNYDNLVVILDEKNHRVLSKKYIDTQTSKNTENNTMTQKAQEIRKEVCPNGIEFNVSGNEIISVKLPIGITVNFDTRNIEWDIKTNWHIQNEYSYVLHTDKSKIVFDSDLRITEYYEKNRKKTFRAGDSWFLDGRHLVQLDSGARIKEFKFKNFRNKIIQTMFSHKKDGNNVMIFSDGTTIAQSDVKITIMHNDKILTYDNRQEFASTYITPQTALQQNAENHTR